MSTYANRKLISVSKVNYEKLRRHGIGSESFDIIIGRLLRNVHLDEIALDIVKGNDPR